MNTRRDDKHLQELAQREQELAERLRPLLTRAVERGLDLFTNQHNLPEGIAYHPAWAVNTECFEQAQTCAELRRSLQLPATGVAHAFLVCCAESHSADPHRRGPRKLAQWLLSQMPEASR